MTVSGRLLIAGGGGASTPVKSLAPAASLSSTKSGSNPTFAFDAIPESIIKVGSTYWCVYQNWLAPRAVNLASSSSRHGPWTNWIGNPLLSAGTQSWESAMANYGISAPEFMEKDGTFYLFYSVEDTAAGTDGAIGVATASSVTGPYTKYASNPILTQSGSGWDSLSVTEPSVVYHDGQWVMAYMGQPDGSPWGSLEKAGIATASSAFGPWTKAAGNPVIDHGANTTWDDDLIADPFIFFDNGYYWIWYSGGGSVGGESGTRKWHSGIASASTPGGPWTKHPDNPILLAGGAGASDQETAWRGSVWVEDNEYSGVYGGLNSGLVNARGHNFTLTIG